MLRNYLIGSLVVHLLVLYGVGFCLPRLTIFQPSEKYFEVIAPAKFSTQNDVVTTMPENKEVKPDTAMILKSNRALLQPIKNSEPSDRVSLNDPSQKKIESTAESFQIASSTESPASPKNTQNQADSLPGKSGASNSLGSDAAGSIGSKNAQTEPDLPVPDVLAVKVYCPDPEYPWKASINNWKGTAVLNVEVLQNGKIGEIKLITSSGYKILDAAALKTVKTWSYKPALKNGKPVIASINIKVHFQ